MSATEVASTSFFQKHRRIIVALVIVASFLGTAVAGLQFKRYADVWMRHPPRMPQCVLISQRLLSHPESVSGSIPHLAPDGNMVYLRPTEDKAIRCLSRLSTSTAGHFAAAFGETEPEKRARALAAILRDHVSTETSKDAEALASYLIASAAIRALPKSDEIDNLRKELQERNACRFDMRSQCPIRPPIPRIVWFLGIPASLGVVATVGWGLKEGLSRLIGWMKKRREAKREKPAPKKSKEDSENKESNSTG
jgi:hypothetical protein